MTLSAGCAVQPPIPRETVRRLAVIEVQPSIGDRALRRVLHDGEKHVAPETLAADRIRINAAYAKTLAANLRCSAALEIITGADFPAASEMGSALDNATLAKLQELHPADAYLRVRVTDYGETPRRWEGAYVTFEVVTTLGIAAALYAHKVTRAVAGAYLLEESIEEFSEGYAGFWALNRLSRPVRIETDMLDGRTGQVVGRETHVGLASWRWRNLWHMNDGIRDQLLDASMRRALKPFTAVGRQLCRP